MFDGTSYFGIILFLVLTGCGLPIPEEVGIIAAGIAAATDKLDPALAFAACMIGALAGDSVMYLIGRVFGRGLMRSKWFGKIVTPEAEARTELLIRKHGLKVFFGARFLVGVRAPMYVAAGIMRLPFARFLIIDGICATIVVGIVYWLSYFIGRPFKDFFISVFHESQVWVTVVLLAVAAIGGLLYWRYHRKHKRTSLAELETKLSGESLSDYEPRESDDQDDAADTKSKKDNKTASPKQADPDEANGEHLPALSSARAKK